jgi:hypothetical protein
LTKGKEAYVPLISSIKVPKSDIAEQNWAIDKWDVIQQKLTQLHGSTISDEERTRQFEERRAIAEKLFPLPQDNITEDF